MQAFANVATAPTRKTTQNGGKAYWEFRAAESAKNEDKAGATWYTVRVFQEDDPGFSKGDFVRLVGKLKLDVFMGREGKPMGVLLVMCYEARKFEKSKSETGASKLVQDDQGPSAKPSGDNQKRSSQSMVAIPSFKATENPTDESWLSLVG